MIEFQGISKTFPGVAALTDVSFTVRRGECHALLGENGAGKSTLGKILAGLYRPDSGQIRLDGKAVRFTAPRAALEAGVGIVHQELVFCSNLSIAENLCLHDLPRQGMWLDRREMRSRAEAALKQIGLEIDVDQPLASLSIGQEQMVQIAAAVALGARVLVFDEPTSSLGRGEVSQLFRLIRRLQQEGVTVIYVSHRLEEIFELCQTVTVLRDGRHVETLPIDKVDHDQLVRLMVGRSVEVYSPPIPEKGFGPCRLRLRGLSSPGRFEDIDLEICAGEIVGLAGLVGAGRTELTEAIYGVDPEATGTVEIDGRRLSIHSPRQAQSAGIGLIPEDRKRHGLVLPMNLRENVTLPILDRFAGALHRIDRGGEAGFASEARTRLAIRAPDVETVVSGLSGGNQQKIVFAKGLAADCRVLMIDEPTRGVDVGARAEIHGIIRRLAQAGMSILVVSSDTKETAALCDRVLVMDRGRVSAELAGDAITREAMIAAASRAQTPTDRPARTARRENAPPLWTRLGDSGVPVAALVITFVVFSLFAPHFLTFQNFDGLARQIVPLAFASLGAMLVILVGGIDLSIGALVSFTNMLSASLLLTHGPELAIVAPLLLGLAVGTVNAVFARLGFPAFLSTYAMALVLTGISLAQFGQSVGPVPESFWVIATAQLGPIPVATLVTLLLFLFAHVGLFRTVVGRHLFAYGADPESARLNGVRPFRMLLIAYATSGGLAAATGLFLSARIGAGLPQSGLGLELEAIAAVVLGGASLFGGHVSVVGTLAGVLVLSVIANGFNLMHIDPFYSGMLRGVIMLVVVGLWAARRRSAGAA